jgi:NAD(P)-dependent dehydrogenase (short-subunit alcohol dehydrogenase family)
MHINAFLTCDCLFKMRESVKDGGKIVVLSSGWSSISQLRSSKALVYRMSKAALNMGVAGMANRDRTVNWILMNPGMVDTKMTENLMMSQTLASEFISTTESAEGVVKSADAVTKQFAFVDYQGQEVPF